MEFDEIESVYYGSKIGNSGDSPTKQARKQDWFKKVDSADAFKASLPDESTYLDPAMGGERQSPDGVHTRVSKPVETESTYPD